jgi:hypothetical protein
MSSNLIISWMLMIPMIVGGFLAHWVLGLIALAFAFGLAMMHASDMRGELVEPDWIDYSNHIGHEH